MEKQVEENFWSELVGQTTSSSVYCSVTTTKLFPQNIFVFTSTTPITKVLHDPEISVNNNDFFPLYFHVPSDILVLDSVGCHNYKTRDSTNCNRVIRSVGMMTAARSYS